MKNILLLILVLSLFSCSNKEKEYSTIIPQVQEIQYAASYFDLSNFQIHAKENTFLSADLLNLELAKLDYKIDTVVYFEDPIKANSINLVIDTTLNSNSEYYELIIKPEFILIKGASREGLLHGIYSLIQLIPRSSGIDDSKLACLSIQDYPKFKWRGLLLDCCRHFMEVDFIKRYIDLLAYHKINVLHWHLTEDQGWRIEIKQYPKLTEVGAWRKEKDGSTYGGFYTQEQIKEIIAYATKRGITVIPEIELPGHSIAALAAYPEYSCTGEPLEVENDWGVFKDIYCAGNDSTFAFLENILDEVIELFPSEYIHIGGDEAPKFRWEHCAKCQARIISEKLDDTDELQSYFIKRIENYLNAKGKKLIGWDEILEGGLADGATVQSWRGFDGAAEAARTGHDAIVSPTSHAYFDYGLESIDLEKVYAFNPIPEGITDEEAKHIIGGECNMWTERAPQNKIDSKVFPRILAMSEVLWNYPADRNYDAFYKRVQNHYMRLDQLGVDYGLETVPVHFNAIYKNELFNVDLQAGGKDLTLYYQINETITCKYDSTFTVTENSLVKAWATKSGITYGAVKEVQLYKHKGLEATISNLNEYYEGYAASGDKAVIDGLRGSNNFRDGNWQGYSGRDFTATLSFNETQKVDSVLSSFFQYNLSWIFMPTKITVYTSTDGANYYNRAEIRPEVSARSEGEFFQEFIMTFPEVEAKYIKIKAENYGICPEWHPAAGSNTWLFIDEVRVY